MNIDSIQKTGWKYSVYVLYILFNNYRRYIINMKIAICLLALILE